MNKEKVADVISVVLGPHIWLPILLLAVIFRSDLNSSQIVILFPSLLFLQVVVPILYLSVATKLGLASAWDLPNRKERRLFLLVHFITSLISLFLIYKFGNEFLLKLNILLFFLQVFLSLVTLFWKISLHTSLNTFGAVLINFLFGWKIPVLYLAIPLVFWARLTLKRHSFSQLLGGIIVSAAFWIAGFTFIK